VDKTHLCNIIKSLNWQNLCQLIRRQEMRGAENLSTVYSFIKKYLSACYNMMYWWYCK
jgi:hypothetical protein